MGMETPQASEAQSRSWNEQLGWREIAATNCSSKNKKSRQLPNGIEYVLKQV